MSAHSVDEIEVVEDFTATGRCDEGFLHVRRLKVRNRRSDGSHSKVYRVDVVDRPRLDAVGVLVYRQGERGLEFLTRQNLRPAAYFRKDKPQVVADGRRHLFCEEIVAGLLEESDHGEQGLRHRAAEEVREEAGLEVAERDVHLLGPPVLVAPGILSEKIFLTVVNATSAKVVEPVGDGSPLEEGGELRWRSEASIRDAISTGEIQDAKTEVALYRFLGLKT
jgi:ADP-ribose pyrophosphatase